MRHKVKIQIRCTAQDCKHTATKSDKLTDDQLAWVREHREYTGRCPRCRTEGSLIAVDIKATPIEPTPDKKVQPQYVPGIRIPALWKKPR